MKKNHSNRSSYLNDRPDTSLANTRRALLEALMAGSAVAVVSVPEKWLRPIVKATVLPAHAQTSETCTPPAPRNDTAFVTNGGSTSINVLANDSGSAPMTVASFGDSTGSVDTFPADGVTVGAFPAPGGGTLDVTIDSGGNLSVIASGTTGSGNVVVYYQAVNDCGDNIGQVEISFGDFPNAVDDTYETDVGVGLNVTAGTGLLNNDTLGTPAATLTAWGGGDASSDVNLTPGTSRSFAGGTLTVNADGSFELLAPTSSGVFTFDYIIENTVGSSQATVEVRVGET